MKDCFFMKSKLSFQFSGVVLVGVGADDPEKPEAGSADRSPEEHRPERRRKS